MIKKALSVPAVNEGLDLTTVLRILLGLPRDADALAICGAVRALLVANEEQGVDVDELPMLARRGSSGRKTRAIDLARAASLERAYLSQGLTVEKDGDGRIKHVFRPESKNKKGVKS